MNAEHAQLQKVWLEKLSAAWAERNQSCLDGQLLPPVFRVGEGARTLGTFEPHTRVLSISEIHILESHWDEVLNTLVHEMAHQVVHELWDVPHAQPHGPEFNRALRMLGAVAEDGGLSSEEAKVFSRIEKLLSLAQSDNEYEAGMATAAANSLLLKYNLKGRTHTKSYSRRKLGGLKARIPMTWKMIGGILSEFFFVECIWVSVFHAASGKSRRQLEVLGTGGNVEMAGYVHDFLHQTLKQLSRDRVRRGESGGRGFQCGVLLGFKETLGNRKEVHRQEGLIWKGDPGLDAFFREAYPRTSSFGGRGLPIDGDLQAGKSLGKKLILRRPIVRRGTKDPAQLQK